MRPSKYEDAPIPWIGVVLVLVIAGFLVYGLIVRPLM